MSEPAVREDVWTGNIPHEPEGAAVGSARLRLVADGGRLVPQAVKERAEPRSRPVRITEQQPARRTPVRLTRRGRLVVMAAAVLVIGAASMILAGAAQATGHSGAPGKTGSGVAKVEIQAGQNLWSVAEAYDPNADTRLVIAEILQLNSLHSDQVQPGQLIWVPRG